MNLEYKITEMLLPFRLTWKNRATADLIRAIALVAEDADRICAVQKEVYAVIAEHAAAPGAGSRATSAARWSRRGNITATTWRRWRAIRWTAARQPPSSSTSALGVSPGSAPQRTA